MNYAKTEVAKLVVSYTKKGKIADKQFVDKVLSLLVNAINVNDFVLKREFEVEEELLGGYDCFTKTIYIDMNKLYDHINYKLTAEKNNGLSNSDYELLLKYNLSFVNTIAHEIFHALQYKMVFENKQNIETELLKLSFEHNLMVLSSSVNNGYLTETEVEFVMLLGQLEKDIVYLDALPSERMACINASKVERDISFLASDHENIKDYTQVKYKMELIRGFLNGNCPSAYIMAVHNKLRNRYGFSQDLPETLKENEEKCINLAKANKLFQEDKFYYGLYVPDEELKPKIKEINALTRKLTNKTS